MPERKGKKQFTEKNKRKLAQLVIKSRPKREKPAIVQVSKHNLITNLCIYFAMNILVVIGIVYMVRFVLLMRNMETLQSDSYNAMIPYIILIFAVGAFYLSLRRTINAFRHLRNFMKEKES